MHLTIMHRFYKVAFNQFAVNGDWTVSVRDLYRCDGKPVFGVGVCDSFDPAGKRSGHREDVYRFLFAFPFQSGNLQSGSGSSSGKKALISITGEPSYASI